MAVGGMGLGSGGAGGGGAMAGYSFFEKMENMGIPVKKMAPVKLASEGSGLIRLNKIYGTVQRICHKYL